MDWQGTAGVAISAVAVGSSLVGLGLLGGRQRRRQVAVRRDGEILAVLPEDSVQRGALVADMDRQVEEMLAERHGPRRNWSHVVWGTVLLIAALYLWGAASLTEQGWLRGVLRVEVALTGPVGLAAVGLGALKRHRDDEGMPVVSGATRRDRVRSVLVG